ncbi:MAG TPA: HupE/UreJ family protein [Opitutaceae bacterium]|nr:HupE/UreJ family protein [Opitutaceae bacterium]
MKLKRFPSRRWLPGLCLAAAPLAQAHPAPGPAVGFGAGVAHPFSGWDHLLALLAIGLWAARLYAPCLIPLAFLTLMAVGAALGHWTGAVPGAEQAIAASVLVFGLLAANTVRLPARVSFALVGFFALFHGAAHGAEMPATASGLAYGAGFVTASALLLGAGAGLGALFEREATRIPQFAGWVIALVGAVLSVRSFLGGNFF